MSAYWLFWLFGLVLLGFLIPELHAIRTKQYRNTLSDQVRAWLHTDTPGGGWTFLGCWLLLLGVWVWFLPHILRWPL